ncbi:unnamed protein product [Penicillium viridicatum]
MPKPGVGSDAKMNRAWFTEKLETVTGNHNTLERLEEKVHIANPDWKSFDVDKMLNEKQLKKKELSDDKVLRTTRMPTPCVAKHANMDTNSLPLLSSLTNSGVDDQFAQMLPVAGFCEERQTRTHDAGTTGQIVPRSAYSES